MAILKDTVVSGSLRATDTVYADTVQAKTIEAPTTSNGTTYGPGTSGQVLKSNGTSVYWATDNNDNTKVTQTATTTNATYEILFSETANNTTLTEGARKTSTLTYNPSTKALVTGGTVDGYDLNAASAKAVDTSIAAASTSTNLPTSKAVAAFVEGKGYKTTDHITTATTSGSGNAVTAVTADANGALTVTKGTTFLTGHQTIKQDGVTGATVNRFGTCSTAAGTAAKAVSITTGTFNLEAGARVSVHFSNANTANSPTLNVNSKGAKNIFHKGAQITNGTNKALLAGVVDFIYDGTQWHLIGNYIDTNDNTKVTSVGNHYTPTTATVTLPEAVEAPLDGEICYLNSVSVHTDAAGHVVSVYEDASKLKSETAASNGTTLSLVTTGEKATWNAKTTNTGTVTKVSTGAGLTGGDITSTGTVKAALTSETKLTNAAADGTETSGRVYPVRLDKNGKLAVNVPWTNVNSGYAASGHTHSLSIATDTGTNELTLAHGSKYKLTAGGDSFVFTMPASGNTDTKVTSAANHYTPAADTNSALTANATGATAAWSIDVVKGVTISRDAKGHVTDVAVTSGKIPANPNTDTKVTSAANHYAPSADSNSELTAAISGTAGAYALNTEYTVLTGVKAQRDAKGHVTGLTYTAQKVKDTNTTYGVATASANGLMAKADKSKLDSFGNAVIFQGTCDTDAATVAKVVTCADFTSADLAVGAKIYVTFTHTNSGARANLTMNVNGTGAKPLRELRNGAVSQIPGNAYILANQTYVFTYDGTNWCTIMDYDTNNVDRLCIPHYIKAGSTGIFPYCLVALDKTGAWSAFTTSGGTGTNKTLNTTTDFLYPPEILVYEANNTAAANAQVASSGASYVSYPDVYLNYSCNCGTTGFTTNAPVYIQCHMTSTGHWRFENITQTFVNGKYYIYLGKTRNDTGGYRIWLSDVHPVYYYNGTSLTDADSHRIGGGSAVTKYGPSAAFSSLPVTFENDAITADMVVLNSVLSNPTAQINNWTVTTAAGSLTISGSIRGSTTITLYLGRCEQEA